jgi:geranylgeranyl diphosphate synthase type I
MRDDVMGAFGDANVTGKPVGGDLREGKPTPLLARAVAKANRSQLAVLDLVGDPLLSDDDVERIQDVIVETGALDDLEGHIASLTAAAIDAIGCADITDGAKTELIALAHYVSSRDL